ncbi:AI-2E family transporter [uncultured Pseudokineococcus sp.]|uniref:AI-2E family transporter n=1 Tax=uncultured Pseudokineococcus sp. TaxID=1642928 RepID=UPI00262DF142|nr:AI-2E family transporter [uncultured Pseudokineococcus sp.]
MSLIQRLRGAPDGAQGAQPPSRGASPAPRRQPAGGGRPRDDDAVDAVVEMRPSKAHPKGRFGRLEHAMTAIALWVLRVLVVVAGLVGVVWLLGQLWTVVLPVVLALILSTVLWPATRLLRRVMPGALAAALSLIVFLGAIVGIFSFLIPRVISQASGLSDQIVAGFEDVQRTFQGGVFGISGDQINTWVDQGIERVQQNAQQIAGSVGGGLLTGLASVGSALITLLLVLVLTFFFLKDGPKFLPWLHLWSGSKVADHADELLGRVWRTLGGYIGSQAAVALVDAIFIGIGLLIIGVPFAFPLAVLVFFGGFIPIVGAVATGALAAFVALFTGGVTDALLTVALVLLVQQIESNVLQPILVGKALALHPAVVIAAVTLGGTLAGIVGAFLAVPIAAVGTVILRYIRESVLGEHPTSDEGEGDGSAVLSHDDAKEIEHLASEGEDTTKAVDAPGPAR